MFANTQMMGTDTAFPDVCLTPAPPSPAPVPTPYPDIALGPTAVPAQSKVLMAFAPAHNMATTTPQTNGDNLGTVTGVASGTMMGPSRHLTGAFHTLICGMPATRLTSATIQNSTNAPGARIVPSQPKVLLLGG